MAIAQSADRCTTTVNSTPERRRQEVDSGPDSGGTYIIFAVVLSVEWDPLTSVALFRLLSCAIQSKQLFVASGRNSAGLFSVTLPRC